MKYFIIMMLFFTGCASYQPLIDTQDVDMNRYTVDLRDCQAYAKQTPGVGIQAVTGAVIGAALGALVTRILCKDCERGSNARFGALAGAISGGASGAQSERAIVQRCMAGRGYRVLQ
ncbi:MAG: glycine zipper family protein [Candidatus Binatia bacterium]|nr:glycine zipper family protein [Candidatus Binatia bacterium]